MLPGHIWEPETRTIQEVKNTLSKIKGHLVWMPLEFLRDETLDDPGLQVNAFTESIYT
jgi:phospholipase D1/2